MKKVLFLAAIFIACVTSCQNQDELLEEETGQLELRSVSTRASAYDYSTKIYRYNRYETGNADHYWGTEAPSGNSRVINGKSYLFEGQDFNLPLTNYGSGVTSVFYRHYDPVGNDHILCNCKSFSGCINTQFLGYIFKEQQPGTVPLVEFYSSVKNDHFYTSRYADWMVHTELDYINYGIIGYVYPGDRTDPMKPAHSITIDYQNFGWGALTTTLNITYKENGQVRTVDFKESSWASGSSKTYMLPSTAVLMNATFSFSKIGSNDKWLFENITVPNYNDASVVARLYIKKLNGCNTIYELKGK